MHKRRICCTLWLFTVALTSCTSPTPVSTIEIAGQADGAPTGCSARDVGERLGRLFAAVSQHDTEQAMRFFGEGDLFEWYSAPEREPQAGTVYAVSDLPAYFARRQSQHEQLQLHKFQANGWDAGRGLVHFQFDATRRADDLGDAQPSTIGGKGAFHCQQQAFIVISLGGPASGI